jgi:hypothetical protein
MDTEKKLSLMQNTYAAAVAETVNTYDRLKVLDTIVEKRAERQNQTAGAMNKMMGIASVEEVFINLADVFGCANWQVNKTADGYEATATACKLCALSKKMGGANACRGWCLDPMTAMIGDVSSGKITKDRIDVQSTLMESDQCKVVITLDA